MVLISLIVSSCSFFQQPITYDPNKNYAAFLVVDSDAGRAALESMKQHTIEESLEIGQIEYYSPGTKDFEPILTRLTASKQVKLVWIISMVLDVPQIKTAMAKVAYEGAYKYAPIMNGIPIQIQQ
jgi:ABC-type branched-subunit amino acid transport system substrate-binding protein